LTLTVSAIAWAILTVTAFLTAILSALIGFGGGIILLAVMLLFLTPAIANATHAAVQLVSNTTRLGVYARFIHWTLVAVYGVGAVVGVAACGTIVLAVYDPANQPLLMSGIGAFVLVLTYLPFRRRSKEASDAEPSEATRKQRSSAAPEGSGKDRPLAMPPVAWWWVGVGAVTGFLGPIVGATGPITAPLFLRAGLIKERLIATKAVCQAWVHLLKLGLFAYVGQELRLFDGLPVLAVVVLGFTVIAGTFVGKRLLAGVSARMFLLLFRVILTAIGAKILILDGLLPILSNG